MLRKIYLELVVIRKELQAIKKDLKCKNQLYFLYKTDSDNLDRETEHHKLNQYIDGIISR